MCGCYPPDLAAIVLDATGSLSSPAAAQQVQRNPGLPDVRGRRKQKAPAQNEGARSCLPRLPASLHTCGMWGMWRHCKEEPATEHLAGCWRHSAASWCGSLAWRRAPACCLRPILPPRCQTLIYSTCLQVPNASPTGADLDACIYDLCDDNDWEYGRWQGHMHPMPHASHPAGTAHMNRCPAAVLHGKECTQAPPMAPATRAERPNRAPLMRSWRRCECRKPLHLPIQCQHVQVGTDAACHTRLPALLCRAACPCHMRAFFFAGTKCTRSPSGTKPPPPLVCSTYLNCKRQVRVQANTGSPTAPICTSQAGCTACNPGHFRTPNPIVPGTAICMPCDGCPVASCGANGCTACPNAVLNKRVAHPWGLTGMNNQPAMVCRNAAGATTVRAVLLLAPALSTLDAALRLVPCAQRLLALHGAGLVSKPGLIDALPGSAHLACSPSRRAPVC